MKEQILQELKALGFSPSVEDAGIHFVWDVFEGQAPLHYHLRLRSEDHLVEMHITWDLVVWPTTEELLTFLTYLNAVESYGHFYAEPQNGTICYVQSEFYENFSDDLDRLQRILGVPVRAYSSAANSLRALQSGEIPAIDVYHRWINEAIAGDNEDNKDNENAQLNTQDESKTSRGHSPSPLRSIVDSPKASSPNPTTDPQKGETDET